MAGDSADNALEFSLVNEPFEIDVAARIDAVCTAHGLAPQTNYEVNLAIDELLTNMICYGYADDKEHRIELALGFESDTLVVEIVDDGRAFDPLQTPEPDIGTSLQDWPAGNLRIYFLQERFEEVAYRQQDGRNVVSVTKSIALMSKKPRWPGSCMGPRSHSV